MGIIQNFFKNQRFDSDSSGSDHKKEDSDQDRSLNDCPCCVGRKQQYNYSNDRTRWHGDTAKSSQHPHPKVKEKCRNNIRNGDSDSDSNASFGEIAKFFGCKYTPKPKKPKKVIPAPDSDSDSNASFAELLPLFGGSYAPNPKKVKFKDEDPDSDSNRSIAEMCGCLGCVKTIKASKKERTKEKKAEKLLRRTPPGFLEKLGCPSPQCLKEPLPSYSKPPPPSKPPLLTKVSTESSKSFSKEFKPGPIKELHNRIMKEIEIDAKSTHSNELDALGIYNMSRDAGTNPSRSKGTSTDGGLVDRGTTMRDRKKVPTSGPMKVFHDEIQKARTRVVQAFESRQNKSILTALPCTDTYQKTYKVNKNFVNFPGAEDNPSMMQQKKKNQKGDEPKMARVCMPITYPCSKF